MLALYESRERRGPVTFTEGSLVPTDRGHLLVPDSLDLAGIESPRGSWVRPAMYHFGKGRRCEGLLDLLWRSHEGLELSPAKSLPSSGPLHWLSTICLLQWRQS